jgi:hypothetical protein
MHRAYLAERGGPDLRPESFPEAAQWALTPTFPGAANSLLVGSAEEGYLAFDYLIDLPESAGMPAPSWSALVESVTGAEAYMLAEHAVLDGHDERAIEAYLRAAETGDANAEAILGAFGVPVRPAPESLERARQYLARIQGEVGPDHEDSLLAELSVVNLTMQNGRYADALVLARDLVVRGERLLGAEHRTVLGARQCIAWCTFRSGDIDGGLHQLNFSVEESIRALGPRDTTTALRRTDIIKMLAEAGRIEPAEAQLTALEADYSDFPSGHSARKALQEAAGSVHENRRSDGK